MTNIPFPNPHDAVALNDYLDALAAGKPANPESDVESAALAFHQLASRATVTSPMQPVESKQGEEMTHTAPLAAPISNRTRRQMTVAERPGRSYGWLSAVIVAGLLISMIGSAWLNRGPGNPNENLAFAPGTAEVTPESEVPWTQPISFTECPADAERNAYDPDNPGNTMYTQEDYDQVSSERSYEIVGPASPENAAAVVTRMREAQGCIDVGKSTLNVTARYEYENRTTAGRESVEAIADEQAAGSESVSTWMESDLGLSPQDMYIFQDPAELTLSGTESLRTIALYNPETAVQFADGRIGVMRSVVTYEPFSDEWNIESIPGLEVYMTVFVYQDGEWMLDENLPVCIGDCSATPAASPMGMDGDVPGERWAETITGTPED